MSELTPVRRDRIQNRITKVIVSDDGEEKLNQIISVNELNETDAEEMIRLARKIRNDAIRGVYMKKVRLGCFILALGMAAVYGFVSLLGTVIKPILYLGGFIGFLGLWMVVAGVAGIASAPSKKGSFADEI